MLRRAVDAILAQDFGGYEVIIQDGGTEHATFNDPRVRHYVEPDSGITDAMNRGMRRAKGEILNWSNDDDEMAPGTLRYVAENIGVNPWMYGKIMYGDSPYGAPWDLELMKHVNIVPQPSVYWTKKAYEMVGEMDPENDLVSDYEYWLRLGSSFDPLYTDRIMAQYNVHPGQITQMRQKEQLEQAERVKLKYQTK